MAHIAFSSKSLHESNSIQIQKTEKAKTHQQEVGHSNHDLIQAKSHPNTIINIFKSTKTSIPHQKSANQRLKGSFESFRSGHHRLQPDLTAPPIWVSNVETLSIALAKDRHGLATKQLAEPLPEWALVEYRPSHVSACARRQFLNNQAAQVLRRG